MLLCDSAQALGGKLYILGGGWTQIAVPQGTPVPMSLAIKLAVPWSRANQRIKFSVVLKDSDGNAVPNDDGFVQLESEFEVGRPPGLEEGTPLDAIFAVNSPGLVLTNGRYVWELEVDGSVAGRAAFRVQVHGE